MFDPVDPQPNQLADNREGGPLSWPPGLPKPGLAPHGMAAPAVIPAARWADDARSPCYSHLGVAFSNATFELTAASMEALAHANHFTDLGGDRVLFGLRGCALDGQQWTELVPAITLREAVPDHRSRRCVVGVWQRSTGLIGAVQGSTVPNADYMFRYTRGIENANMLPTGCYSHRVRHHHPGDPESIVHNIFRLDEDIVPLRSPTDLCFTREDFWDQPQNPFDNVHPGGRFTNELGMEFDSAGCQTAHGGYDRSNRFFKGFFAQLRELAGLANPTPAAEIGTRFRYVLLTGREARLATSAGELASLRRLRFGSRGPAVRALQVALGLAPDPGVAVFGPNTAHALISHQRQASAATGGPASADGIVTPALAQSFGIAFDV